MKKRGVFLLLLAAILLFLLLPGSVAAYYQFASPITARVEIRPSVKTLQNSSTLTVVSDQPDGTQHQISGARMLSATANQAATQTATGQGNGSATSASGILAMTWAYMQGYAGGDITEPAGSILKGTNGITVITDETGKVPLSQTTYIRAHVASPGSHGNMPIHAFSASDINKWVVTFTNSTPFTGGEDGGPYTFVQQNDITSGEQTLEPMVKQSALGMLNAQVKTAEQWAQTPTCTTKDATDGIAGERVQNFHVTVSATCSGEVYDTQSVKNTANQVLTTLASNTLGSSYQLQKEISTTITQVQVLDKQGTLAVSFTAAGKWAYRFSQADKKHLAQLIGGKSVVDAQRLLAHQAGVEHATVTLSHNSLIWNAVPTDPNKISIAIL